MSEAAWIENSLARLEALEAHRAELEAGGRAIDMGLSAEISGLYASLERAAQDRTDPVPERTATGPVDPVAVPQPMTLVPTREVDLGSELDDDDAFGPVGRGQAPLVIVVALLVSAVGGGGWWALQGRSAEAAVVAPPPEPEVIVAAPIPEDTQEPKGAEGADVDRTQGRKAGRRPRAGRGGGVQESASPSELAGSPKAKLGRARGNDPLAGLR